MDHSTSLLNVVVMSQFCLVSFVDGLFKYYIMVINKRKVCFVILMTAQHTMTTAAVFSHLTSRLVLC